MLRYVAVVAAGLLLPLALADSFSAERDANLALINAACLVVGLDASTSSTYGTNASTDKTIEKLAHITAAKIELANDLTDKATLYGVPVKTDCTQDERNAKPLVFLYLQVVGTALSYDLRVLLPAGMSGFAYPSVWSESGLLSRSTGVIPQDVTDEAAKAFEDFALAWKKAHKS